MGAGQPGKGEAAYQKATADRAQRPSISKRKKAHMKNIWTYSSILTLFLFFPSDFVVAAPGDTLCVQGNGVNVRTGPGKDFPILVQVSRDTKVIEGLSQGDWVSVKLSETGETGWIHATLLKSQEEADTARELDEVAELSELASEKHLLVKIGVVDIQRIILESKWGKEIREYVKDLIPLRSKEDLAKTEQEFINRIIRDVEVIIEEYAREKGFSLIIRRREVLFFIEERFDITDDIIRRYDEQIEALRAKP